MKQRDEILNADSVPSHTGHGIDFGECNSMKNKKQCKEKSFTKEAKPEKALIATITQSADLITNECTAKLPPEKEYIKRGI